jgi:hypothetical protein
MRGPYKGTLRRGGLGDDREDSMPYPDLQQIWALDAGGGPAAKIPMLGMLRS